MHISLKSFLLASLMLLPPATAAASVGDGVTLTRGIGKYPGNPQERFAARLVPSDSRSVRNLALLRPVRTSSAFDHNLTGQLLTDGIIDTRMPPLLTVSTASGLLPRREREWTIDCGEWTHNTLMGSSNYLQYEWTGMSVQANCVGLRCTVAYDEAKARGGYRIRLLMRQKVGGEWRTVAENSGDGLPGVPARWRMSSDPNKQGDRKAGLLPARDVRLSLPLPSGCHDIAALRLEVSMEGAAYWNVYSLDFYDGTRRLMSELLPNSRFGSAWMSGGEGRQWASVDLGRTSRVSRVTLDWIRRPQKGSVEVSADGTEWRKVASLPDGSRRRRDRIDFAATDARYVRLAMDGGSRAVSGSDHAPTRAYILSEMGVYGTGGFDIEPCQGSDGDGGRMSLDGGPWRLCRASLVRGGGAQVSTRKFREGAGWIPATVPGTVLTSFVDAGALGDPNLGDSLFDASDSYFNSDFWYRRTFRLPDGMRGKRVSLNFDGINWKADVWLNGHPVDRIEGAFCRGRVDVTRWLTDGDNTIAVLIHSNAHPGAVKEKNSLNTDYNGGVLGRDNPTFHAAIGWDWISTIRGRNIGIWNDVYLTATQDIILSDPVVTTRLALPDTAATLIPRVVAANTLDRPVTGTLRGWIGNITFSRRVVLEAGEEHEIAFAPEDFPELRGRRMRLWWPNGYGEPFLHEAGFEFTPDGGAAGGGPTARIDYRAGIRQMTYADAGTQLKLYVNGRRFVPLGGNWGFPEANLNYRAREYDIAVRLHRDMNFNMIRNWVGMTGDEEFYDACDRYGIMVWQDFWLANPADGPDPDNEGMFTRNARDFTRRMRRHPSIGLYCGRNEGYPPATLDRMLRQTVGEMNPGLLYISSSADDGVSGHGPYSAEPPRTYFMRQSGKLHSERGMPNVMTWEGLSRTIAPSGLWPQGDAWGQHDFTQAGAQRGASFSAIVERMFGKAGGAEQFAGLAQWENYEGYRAMYESCSRHRQGLLIWMSHPCWPSLTWQCYDYYFEPTAAFFACRKACEPLHIQWNALTRNVEVVNTCAPDHGQLTAKREILDIMGRPVDVRTARLTASTDTTVVLAGLRTDSVPSGIDGVYYVRLTLGDTAGQCLSSNFYVLSTDEGNLQQLNSLPEVNLQVETARPSNDRLRLTLRNASDSPAMMLRLNLKADDGEQVLPVNYSDNYFHLMPGDERTVEVEWSEADARGLTPFVELTGFNVKQRTLR